MPGYWSLEETRAGTLAESERKHTGKGDHIWGECYTTIEKFPKPQMPAVMRMYLSYKPMPGSGYQAGQQTRNSKVPPRKCPARVQLYMSTQCRHTALTYGEVCTCTQTRVHTHARTDAHMYTLTHTHTQTHAHRHTRTLMGMHAETPVYTPPTLMRMHTDTCVHTRTHGYIHVHTCIHAHTDAQAHQCACTETPVHTLQTLTHVHRHTCTP